MRISIAMATFNGAKYLQEQLDSFLQQTLMPHELVVCDDGSTDTTVEILKAFSQHAPFEVRLFFNEENLGFTKNFEKALTHCTGDLIFLSDQDDVWYSEKISVVISTFVDHRDKLLIVHDGEITDESLASDGLTKLRQVVAGYGTTDPLITGALTAFRRELLSYALPIPVGITGHDMWLHNIAYFLETRLVLHRSLQFIRRHSTNTSGWSVSSIKKINRIDVWKDQFRTPVSTGYEDRLLMNESSNKRLNKILSQSAINSFASIHGSLLYLQCEHCALEYRSKLIHSSRLVRKVMAMRLLLNGGYKYFNGFRSFMRDMFR